MISETFVRENQGNLKAKYCNNKILVYIMNNLYAERTIFYADFFLHETLNKTGFFKQVGLYDKLTTAKTTQTKSAKRKCRVERKQERFNYNFL